MGTSAMAAHVAAHQKRKAASPELYCSHVGRDRYGIPIDCLNNSYMDGFCHYHHSRQGENQR